MSDQRGFQNSDEVPGGAGERGAQLGDLGEIYWKALEFEQAEEQFESRLATAAGSERALALRRIGQCRERRGDYRAALSALREAAAAARAAGDRLEEGRAAYMIAKVSFLTGDLTGSRELALRARPLLAGSDSASERGAIENLLGGIAYRSGDLHRARRHFEEALLLGKDDNDLTLLSRAHNNLGLIHKALCDWDQAIDSFHASLGFDSTASNYDSRYTAWINLGIVHAKRSDWREAESMFQRAYKTCVEVGNPLGQVRSLLGLASVERARRHDDDVERRLREAEALASEHRYRRELVLIATTRAWLALDRGQLERCRELLEAAQPRAAALAPGGELTCHLERLAATLAAAAGDERAAAASARACTALAEQCGDRLERAAAARIMGNTLAAQGRWSDAERHYRQGVGDLRRMGERHELGRLLRDWGAAATRDASPADVRTAIDRLREGGHLLEQVGDVEGLAAACAALAELYHRRSRVDEALDALSRAWGLIERCRQPESLRERLQALQARIEEQLLAGTSPPRNRVTALVALLESVRQIDGRASPLSRLLDQIGELVGADGALLAATQDQQVHRTGTFKVEAASGLRLAEKRAILEVLDDNGEELRDSTEPMLFAADLRGSRLPIAARLAATRPAASVVLTPLHDVAQRLWILYLDRGRDGDASRAFSSADLELLSAAAGLLPGALEELARRSCQRPAAALDDPTAELELGELVCEDPHLRALLGNVAQIRGSSIRVLLQGETGTGKGLLARIIHRNSVRKDRPFRVLNCATLPETLLESELFGHVRGAFTGATADKIGLLAEVDGGTIFLDDIEKAGASVQRGLLHFLDCGEIRPVGSTRRRSLDVRVICATSSPDLEVDVQQGTFSKDLYYRLHHLTMTLPPLRERVSSILPLARHFLRRFVAEQGGTAPLEITPAAVTRLESFEWPGNVRELENAMRLAAVLGRDASAIDVPHLPASLRKQETGAGPTPTLQGTLNEQVEALETVRVREALQLLKGNKSRTAEYLGLTRKGLRNKMRRYGIEDETGRG